MEKQNLTTGFQNVDNSAHQFLIQFLEDVSVFPPAVEGFEIQLNLLDIKEGDHVLDVGCGIGISPMAFDCIRTERVLMYIGDARVVLKEFSEWPVGGERIGGRPGFIVSGR